jgi:steroid delta-isomerase-like uncharacterized protein
MESQSVIHRYVDAWNQHDTAGLSAAFAATGTWLDPSLGAPISRPAVAAHIDQLFVAFPDLMLVITPFSSTAESTIAVQWRMTGTNLGPFMGQPPSGGRVDLCGADFLTISDASILTVQRYFDQKAFLEQIGLQVLVQPSKLGPLTFGGCLHLDLGRTTKPGAFSINILEFGSEQERAETVAFSQPILQELGQMPGFISLLIANEGARSYLITAWEAVEHPKQLLRGGTHKQAIGRFAKPDFIASEFTSVWTPSYMHWRVRCPNCGHKVKYERANGKCQCGAVIPEPPAYW